jgi:SAM-dependent methyltransferase/NAD(P)-dependent dehydrogenase (short-subunit alcohol dehydrogenase family)/acyl carrier protein
MPTPAYLEMAMAAAEKAGLPPSPFYDTWEIRNVQINEALVFPKNEEVCVQTIFTQHRQDGGECRFYSGTPVEGGMKWRTHANCQITEGKTAAPHASEFDLKDIRARCNREISVDSFYDTIRSLGLEFGPAFRGIRRIWKGNGEALGEMNLPAELNLDTQHYRMHPAFLDACFHLVGAVLGEDAPKEPYLLISIERVSFFQKPPSRFWNLTRLNLREGGHWDSIGGNVTLFNEDGCVIAVIRNLVLRKIKKEALVPRHTGEQDHDLFYTVNWLPHALPQASNALSIDGLTEPKEMAKILHLGFLGHAREHGLAVYYDLLPHLDQWCAMQIVHGLRKAGVDLTPGHKITLPEVRQCLNMSVRYERLIKRLLDILVEDGFLVREGNSFRVMEDVNFAMMGLSPEEMIRQYPSCTAEIELTARCTSHLVDVIRGDYDPLHLLFPHGQMSTLEKIYQESPYAHSFNAILGDAIAHETEIRQKSGRVVNILEIGAGTGGTTSHLLPLLDKGNIHYVFSDISPVFIARARGKYKDYPCISFETLDIEVDPGRQGFASRKFDIVIAANVLHATKDLKNTIGHVKQLMVPRGLLLLLEGTAPQRWVDLTFGLTDGWWRFEDTNLRPDYPLISPPQWGRLLEDVGLNPATVASEDLAVSGEGFPQAVIVAREPETTFEGNPDNGCWLVFKDGEGVSDKLVSQIESAGGKAVRIDWTADYASLVDRKATVRCDRPEDFEPLIQSLLQGTERPLSKIVYFWNSQNNASTDKLVPNGLTALLSLMQALINTTSGLVQPKLWVCTRGAQPISATERQGDLRQAALWGLTRVFGLEQPQLLGGLVDIDNESPAEEAAALLLAHIMAPDSEDQSAFRGGRRLVPRLERVEDATIPNQSIQLQQDASYLITGGLGGLGLKIAKWMAHSGAKRLILLSRKELPARASWGSIRSDSLDTALIREIQSIEDEGVIVEPISANVSDQSAMGVLFRRLQEDKSHPLRGIVHAAVQMSSYSVEELNSEKLTEMFQAKVGGAILLDELSRDIPLDFFVMFSSTTSLWGVAGMGHYAAANQVMDALAHRRRQAGLTALSINWGTWEEMRIASDAERLQFKQAGLNPIPIQLALETLNRLLGWNGPQICVASVDWDRLRSVYEARKPRPFFRGLGVQSVSRTENSFEVIGSLQRTLRGKPKSRWNEILVKHLQARVKQVLRLESDIMVDPEKGFFEMGMDSLMAVELKSAIEKDVAIGLPSTLTFNYPTINALTLYLIQLLSAMPIDLPLSSGHHNQLAPGEVRPEVEDLTEEELSQLLMQKLKDLE